MSDIPVPEAEWFSNLEASLIKDQEQAKFKKSIFISYRTVDTAWAAGRIYDRLRIAFPGRVFLDVEINPGQDFRNTLEIAVKSSLVCLVVIGSQWLRELIARLSDEEDWVRWEISVALAQSIPVIPLLIDDAVMPRAAELPEAIKDISWLNPYHFRHREFDAQISQFIALLRRNHDL